jgi:branched-chain amino acid transport system substrate-binding protein
MKRIVRSRGISYFAIVLGIMIITIHPVYAQEKGKPLKIGFVTSLTGPLTGWGVPASIVYKWVVDQVNKEGGIKSMGGAKVEIYISDCESDPKKVATEVEKMITLRKPQVMLHVVGSPMTKVALPVCQRHKIAMVGNDYSDELWKLNNPYQFGVMPKVSKMATEMADFFIKTGKETSHPIKKASILCQDGSFGELAHDTWASYLPTKGVEVVAHEIFPTGKVADFSDTFAKFKALKADVNFSASSPYDGVLITKGIKAADFNPLGFTFVATCIDTADYLKLGKDADFAFGAPVLPRDEVIPRIKGAENTLSRFYSDVGEKGKLCSPMWTLQLMFTVGTIIHALEKAASYNPTFIRDTLAKLELKTGDRWIYWPGGVKFDSTGFNVRSQTIGGQYQNMKLKVMYPESLVIPGNKPVWPIPKWSER